MSKRHAQFPSGHTPFLPDNGTKTICADCKKLIPAELGHPSGQRCAECHRKFLKSIRKTKQ